MGVFFNEKADSIFTLRKHAKLIQLHGVQVQAPCYLLI